MSMLAGEPAHRLAERAEEQGWLVTGPGSDEAVGFIGGEAKCCKSFLDIAFLRELQRRHGLAIVVVHHARKGAGNVRAGQSLRGSSEFHAWGGREPLPPP
jgi:hypothetical protein